MTNDEREFLARLLEALALLTPRYIPMELFRAAFDAAERAGIAAVSQGTK